MLCSRVVPGLSWDVTSALRSTRNHSFGIAIESACEGEDEGGGKSNIGEEGSSGTRGSGSDGIGKDGDDGGSSDKGGKGDNDGKGGNGSVDKGSGNGGKGSKVKNKDLRRVNKGVCCVVGMERELGGEGDMIMITDVM